MSMDPYEASEEQNMELVSTVTQTEKFVASFYSAFPYPWRSYTFDYVEDSQFYAHMLSQELGYWQKTVLPLQQGSIWVAGCGTNQGITTALHFPDALVVGSDISEKSLEAANHTTKDLRLKNLMLNNDSILTSRASEAFDYIICTGVIHHTATPALALTKLAQALKPTGIIELMVYNRYHRILTSSFQKAIRLLNPIHDEMHFASDLQTANQLLKSVDESSWIAQLLGYPDHPLEEAALADALINPVEHSYTVKSLALLADACGLRLVAPCINAFDRTRETYNWDIMLEDDALQAHYESLTDEERWYTTNLLRFERSPMLWFYLQRKDSPSLIPSTSSMCNTFLDTVFRKSETIQHKFLLKQEEHYSLHPGSIHFPSMGVEESVRGIFKLVNGKRTMREIFTELALPFKFTTVNLARIHLTTTQFPYLLAT